ncbi:MAG: Eco57I restriction-modification methylase domain-containing protein [Kiritimatiellia bacterium]
MRLKENMPSDVISPRPLNGRAMICVLALALTELRPLREQIERRRLAHAEETPTAIKQELGQYFTPGHIADFMAAFFPKATGAVRILDPGAGIGSLSCAFAERIASEKWNLDSLCVDAYEIDQSIVGQLHENLTECFNGEECKVKVLNGDFLEATAQSAASGDKPLYTHVIMNPPYRKIRTTSRERAAARAFGVETVNLYTAFLGAAIVSTIDGGHIVAIVPRSFCNGVYYKSFREFMLKHCAIERIHLFDSRDTAFQDESVLQENIIVMLRKNSPQGDVLLTYSKDGSLKDVQLRRVPFSAVVHPGHREQYINIPPCEDNVANNALDKLQSSLKDIGIQVSTGSIVDFRAKDELRMNYVEGAVPLIYPVHFKAGRVRWPVESKRPNAIMRSAATAKLLLPRGYYVAVKRFSAKEEKRRLVASIVGPDDFKNTEIAFENHLNVFMQDKHGLDKFVALGLTVWLNTTWIDGKFRLFSGHTQVNAADLRNLPYPSAEQLSNMGSMLESEDKWSQEVFDKIALEVAHGK